MITHNINQYFLAQLAKWTWGNVEYVIKVYGRDAFGCGVPWSYWFTYVGKKIKVYKLCRKSSAGCSRNGSRRRRSILLGRLLLR